MTYFLAALHALLFTVLAGNLCYLRRGRRRADGAASGAAVPLSVVVPARNEEDNLRRLLPSLLAQDHPSFEVVVYDDGSDDATWAVLQSFDDPRLHALRGQGPPPGWIGKVHALYAATRRTTGEHYLFLDADARLRDDGALRRLAARFESLPGGSVMTGLTRLRGGGRMVVSLIPATILTGLPWPLVRRTRSPALAALNGQCWMIDRAAYHRHEPHAHVRGEILEDVQIGRLLKRRGLVPVMVDVQDEVDVFMYRDIREAWRGFRKNAYLIMGGRPATFVPLFAGYVLAFVLAPLYAPWLLASVYALKTATDLRARFPWWMPLLAPLTTVLGAALQLDSAASHWLGRVTWKGRRVT